MTPGYGVAPSTTRYAADDAASAVPERRIALVETQRAERMAFVSRIDQSTDLPTQPCVEPLVHFLAAAMRQWRAWPPRLDLIWRDAPKALDLRTSASGGTWETPAPPPSCSQLQVGFTTRSMQEHLAVEFRPADGRAPFMLLASPAHDVFGAIAAALETLGLLEQVTGPGESMAFSVRFRRALGDWLRWGAGAEIFVPAELEWTCVPPPRASGLAPSIIQTLAQDLRQGRWSDTLRLVVPHLLQLTPPSMGVRLPDLIELHNGGTHIYRAMKKGLGTEVRTVPGQQEYELRHPKATIRARRYYGPDGLILAMMDAFCGGLLPPVPWLRSYVADLIEKYPEVVKICLALRERHPGESNFGQMLRLCVQEGRPTWAGRQLLGPPRAYRPVVSMDIERWISTPALSEDGRLGRFFREGVDVIDAHRCFSPLGPTRAGWLLHGNAMHGNALNSFRKERLPALVAELPLLCYVHPRLGSLAAYLGMWGSALNGMLTPEQLHQGRLAAESLSQRSVLVLEPAARGAHPLWRQPGAQDGASSSGSGSSAKGHQGRS